jgi:hypothetical protein
LVHIFKHKTSGHHWCYVPGCMASFCHVYSSDGGLFSVSSKHFW